MRRSFDHSRRQKVSKAAKHHCIDEEGAKTTSVYLVRRAGERALCAADDGVTDERENLVRCGRAGSVGDTDERPAVNPAIHHRRSVGRSTERTATTER